MLDAAGLPEPRLLRTTRPGDRFGPAIVNPDGGPAAAMTLAARRDQSWLLCCGLPWRFVDAIAASWCCCMVSGMDREAPFRSLTFGLARCAAPAAVR